MSTFEKGRNMVVSRNITHEHARQILRRIITSNADKHPLWGIRKLTKKSIIQLAFFAKHQQPLRWNDKGKFFRALSELDPKLETLDVISHGLALIGCYIAHRKRLTPYEVGFLRDYRRTKEDAVAMYRQVVS